MASYWWDKRPSYNYITATTTKTNTKLLIRILTLLRAGLSSEHASSKSVRWLYHDDDEEDDDNNDDDDDDDEYNVDKDGDDADDMLHCPSWELHNFTEWIGPACASECNLSKGLQVGKQRKSLRL